MIVLIPTIMAMNQIMRVLAEGRVYMQFMRPVKKLVILKVIILLFIYQVGRRRLKRLIT